MTSPRPATLLISPWNPYPLVFGGAIRVYYLMRMLASFSDVTLVAFRSWEQDDDAEDHLREICERVVIVDGKPAQDARLRARSIVSRSSFQHLAHHTARMQDVIDGVVRSRDFDQFVVTLTQMGSYQLPRDHAVRVLDTHNIEHELLLRRAAVERRPAKRAGLWLEGHKFKREEFAICRDHDLVLVPSDRERDILRAVPGVPPIVTIPNTIDPDRVDLLPPPPAANRLLFIGATQVDANRDGLLWFVDEVLPLIAAQVPDVSLAIVGGNPPPEVLALADRGPVDVVGFVPEIGPSMAEAAVFVVPLRSGGGTRLKILESLAYGVPTVSTTVGAEGLDLVDGRDLLLGDEPADLAAQVVKVLRDRDLAERLRTNGRAAVEAGYSWQALAGRLETAIDDARARLR